VVGHLGTAPQRGGDRKLERGLAAHLPAPRDFDDWHYLTQLNQARALAFGIEHFRSLRPYCMGTVVWQFNDCWPAISWSVVDGDGRRKPLWYALRRVFADHLTTIQSRRVGPALAAVNDGGEPWEFTATVSLRGLAGAVLDQVGVAATVDPDTVLTVPLDMAPGSASEFLVADADSGRAWWFGAEDKDIAWPPAAYTAAVEQTATAARVTITAHDLLRDLTLYPDRLHPDAEVDLAGVTLLPGESVTFTVTGATGPDPAALTRRPVLRCVNDLG
jgi:beta-mannosidase